VRLALDVHLSDQRVGNPLRAEGHDVIASHAPSTWSTLDDASLLRACAAERRILISLNRKDFVRIAVDFAGRGEPHSGLLLVTGARKDEVSRVLATVDRALVAYPTQDAWREFTLVVGAAP
jgi:Domain of unknown function (DUF5615)